MALASGLSEAGVIDYIGCLVAANKALTFIGVGCILVVIVLFMTELMSNVALVAIFAPVVAGIATGLGETPLHLLIPFAMASSCAFMLPMATPPNALVFASGHIKVHEMAKAGFVLDLISIGLVIVFMIWVIPLLF